ncbi:MAG: hypothetical protein RLZZ423_1192 [Cyanobacteriota bacterium]|jgi:hypothetical protein
MDRPEGRRGQAQAGPGDTCPACGGSGVLRTDASGYRTCLECVGQGSLPRYEASGFPPPAPLFGTPAEVLGRRVRRGGVRGGLSAWTSGAR